MNAREVIVRPVISEKSYALLAANKYTFRVHEKANKIQIKAAVEALFNVSVTNVNTITQKGKTKRWKGTPYQRSDFKKAVVTLAYGQSIDITTGI